MASEWKEQIASIERKQDAFRAEVSVALSDLAKAVNGVRLNVSPTTKVKNCEHCAGHGTIPVTEDAPLVSAIRHAVQGSEATKKR
jgi:hypothetical protein